MIIFQLLCLARHPFSGRYLGAGEPPDIERAIRESRYAFSPSATMGGRPTPQDWVPALEELGREVRRCAVNHGHYFHGGAGACPWCGIEGRSGTQLFPVVFVGAVGEGAGIALIWQQVTSIREPVAGYRLPVPRAGRLMPSAGVRAAGRRNRRRRRLFAAGAAVAAAAILAFVPPSSSLQACPIRRRGGGAHLLLEWACAPREVDGRLQALRREWSAIEQGCEASAAAAAFTDVRSRLDGWKREHDGLPAERARRLQRLAADRARSQMAHHLETFDLSAGAVAGIGKARLATLQSHGIETAGDVEAGRIAAIPGFGPKSVASLVAFRRSCEASFRYDPDAAVAPADIGALNRELGVRRNRIEADLSKGLARLKVIVAEVDARRAEAAKAAAEAEPRLVQALADARAVGIPA